MACKVKVFVFLSLLSLSVRGQEADTLAARLGALPPGKERVDLLNTIVSLLRERNVYEAVQYGTEAMGLAKKLGYKPGYGLALENLGWIYYRRGLYTDAFELSQEALKITTELGDSTAMARCLNNVAAINYEKAQYREALKRFRQAYAISWRRKDIETAVRSLNNISFSYLGLKKIDSAGYYAQKALEGSKANRDGYLPAFSFRILGDIEFEKGNFEPALKNYREAMRISEATGNYFIQASTLHRIGKVYASQKKFEMALETLNKNVQIARQNGYADELERTYKLIAGIHYSNHEVKRAYQYLNRHLAIHDSLINQRNGERMGLLSAQFESEIKQSQIEALEQDAKIREEEIKRQEILGYVYVGGFVLLMGVAFILFFTNRKIKRINIELELKKRQVESQSAQLKNINQAKDKLLSIISHDMRSPLSSLRGVLNIAQAGRLSPQELGALTGQIRSQLDTVYDDLANLLQWTQSQLQGLKVTPGIFDLGKMADEVALLFEAPAGAKGVVLANQIEAGLLAHADPNHVKLILRNLLSNAIKFSTENGKVTLSAKVSGEFVEVSVADTGVGIGADEISKLFDHAVHFTKEGTKKEKGMGIGLLLVREFVEKNGGVMNVQSSPGEGSVFSFTLKQAT